MDIARINQHKQTFDEIMHFIKSDDGQEQVEIWFARELQPVLGYARWENFLVAISRAVESCKTQNINVDDHFREVTKMVIRSKGDTALFGGNTTEDTKKRLGIKSSRPLADFLPTLTIAAKNLATEMTNYNVEQKDLQGEISITQEHVQNNISVRQMLGQRGIRPENLPFAEDIKKVERRVASHEKQIEKTSPKLPKEVKDEGEQ